MNPIYICAIWQALLASFANCFHVPTFSAFKTWITGLVVCPDEHTATGCVTAADACNDWRQVEYCAEYAAWSPQDVESTLAALIQTSVATPFWHNYAVVAVDDTKVHRSSRHVWGTCTFHQHSTRCPNRAQTVRAHNWVQLGRLLPCPQNPDSACLSSQNQQPALYLPISNRLYFRQSQLPADPDKAGCTAEFNTRCDLAVDLIRRHAQSVPLSVEGPVRHLAVFDGGFCRGRMLTPLFDGCEPIAFLTRIRHDAVLYRLPGPQPAGKRGRPRIYGARLSPPRHGGRWPGAWQTGCAFIYGEMRQVRWKEVICLWRGGTEDRPVKAIVAEVDGLSQRLTLLTSDLEMSGLVAAELFAARFRQEDGFRDLKQRLGWEECRAWTKNPVIRTTTMQTTALSLLRLMQLELEARGGQWWPNYPWYPQKTRGSVKDMVRLLQGMREEFLRGLAVNEGPG